MTTFSRFHRHPSTDRARAGAAEPFWQLLCLGLITVLFGIAVLAWPDQTLHLLGVLAGVWMIVLGGTRAVAGFDRERRSAARVLSGVTAVVLIAAGIACVTNAAGGVVVLATIIGLAWLLSGFAELTVGLFTTGPVRVWMSVLGVVSIAVGLTFMLWPAPSLRTLVLLTGISALLIGAGEVASALRLRKSGEALAGPGR